MQFIVLRIFLSTLQTGYNSFKETDCIREP